MESRFGRAASLLAAIAIAVSAAGCISHNETVHREEERIPVSFETEKAARVFYEQVASFPNPHGEAKTTTTVNLPLVLDTKRTVVTGRNRVFNQAVILCDTNKDGTITELEANIFAENRDTL